MTDEMYRPLLDGSAAPRYTGIATFMRTPYVEDLGAVDIGLVGVPVDHSATIRPGTRHGPSGVREMSRYLHPINSVHVNPFELNRIADIGDTPVDPLDYGHTLKLVEEYFHNLRGRDVVPVAIGGDHSVTLPILRGLFEGVPFGLLDIDSHHDTFDEALGNRENNATGVRRVVEEGLVDPKRVVQLGLRGGHYGPNDYQFGTDAGFRIITYDEYEELGRAQVIQEILRVIGDGPAYVTIDIDGIDPSQAPGTGLPEVGGLSVRDVQVILRSLAGRDVVGADICEVSPPLDVANMTSLVAANLMLELVCLVSVARASRRSKEK